MPESHEMRFTKEERDLTPWAMCHRPVEYYKKTPAGFHPVKNTKKGLE